MATSTAQGIATVPVWDYLMNPGDPTSATPKGLSGKKVKVTFSYAQGQSAAPVTLLGTDPVNAQTDLNGFWQVNLVPNNKISPGGTIYTVEIEGYRSYVIQVTDVNAPAIGWQSAAIATLPPIGGGAPGYTLPGGTSVLGGLSIAPGEPGLDVTAPGPLLIGDNLATSIELGTNANVQGTFTFGSTKVVAPAPNGTDDTTALQALVGTPGVEIELQGGTYLTSAPLVPAVGVRIRGLSRKLTVLKPLAGFTGAGNRGVVQFTALAALYSGNAVEDLQFDMSAAPANVVALYQLNSNLQHCRFANLWFELTASATSGAVVFEGLGNNAAASFDLTFENFFVHNGSSSLIVYLNANGPTSIYHSMFIQNIVNLVDVNGVSDDRVAIIGNQPSGGGNPEVRDIAIRGVYTTIAANVASGTVNSVKVDTGSTGGVYVHNISIRDVFHRNYGSGVTNSPVVFLLGASAFCQDIFIDNVYAINSGAMTVRLARSESDPSITITNVHMKGCTSNYCLEVYSRTIPVGDESVLLRNLSLNSSVAVSGNAPVGILLWAAPSTAGGSGIVLIDGCELENLSIGITNNLNESLATSATAWTNIQVSNTDFSAVTSPFLMGAGTGWSAVNCPGYNPIRIQAPAFAASFTPVVSNGTFIQPGVLTANMTINAVAGAQAGLQMTLIFVQDATGGRTLTWNAVYKTAWQPAPAANAVSSITLLYDGANWQQIAGQVAVDQSGTVFAVGGLRVTGDGSGVGYSGSLYFPSGTVLGIASGAASSAPAMFFDHLGSGNTGTWSWRNGTSAGTTRMSLSALGDLTYNGHLLSSASGTPVTSNLGANVTSATFSGNDTRGEITIVMSAGLAANTRVCTCTFAASYGATPPKVILVDQTSTAGLAIVNSYVLATSTGVSFDLAFDQALVAGTYKIDYVVIG